MDTNLVYILKNPNYFDVSEDNIGTVSGDLVFYSQIVAIRKYLNNHLYSLLLDGWTSPWHNWTKIRFGIWSYNLCCFIILNAIYSSIYLSIPFPLQVFDILFNLKILSINRPNWSNIKPIGSRLYRVRIQREGLWSSWSRCWYWCSFQCLCVIRRYEKHRLQRIFCSSIRFLSPSGRIFFHSCQKCWLTIDHFTGSWSGCQWKLDQ